MCRVRRIPDSLWVYQNIPDQGKLHGGDQIFAFEVLANMELYDPIFLQMLDTFPFCVFEFQANYIFMTLTPFLMLGWNAHWLLGFEKRQKLRS